jgi:hypothetical protein
MNIILQRDAFLKPGAYPRFRVFESRLSQRHDNQRGPIDIHAHISSHVLSPLFSSLRRREENKADIRKWEQTPHSS